MKQYLDYFKYYEGTERDENEVPIFSYGMDGSDYADSKGDMFDIKVSILLSNDCKLQEYIVKNETFFKL